MTETDVLVVGEALVDIVRESDGTVRETPGGSPANVAITLGRLGRSPRLRTRIADDKWGLRVRSWLEADGVIVDSDDAERTATATAHLNEMGAAEYEFDIAWSIGRTDAANEAVVHTGSIAALLPPGADEVRDLLVAHRDRALISYDPNIRPSLLSDHAAAVARVDEIVALSDLVKASDEDLLWLYPDRTPRDSARAWAAAGPSLVVVTAGGEGSFAISAAGEIEVPATVTTVVDTVGAGDTFMAALIDGVLAASDPRAFLNAASLTEIERMLARAARAAAITVSRPGADPPTRVELDATDQFT